MKRIPLLLQILIVSMSVLILMAILGYTLVLPALEAPYLEQQYEDLEYRMTDFKDSRIIRSDPSYIYLQRNEDDLIHIAENTLEIEPTYIASYLRQLDIDDDSIHHGAFNLENDDTRRFYFVYQENEGQVYFTGTITEIHPFFSNQVITNQMVFLILLAFFLPVIAIILWSLSISGSIHSLKHIYANQHPAKKRPRILSRELADLETALNDYQSAIEAHDVQKQRLFQNISHELKTPVTTIQSYAEAIEDGIIDHDGILDTSKTIQSQTKTLMDTLNQIMHLNKLAYEEQNPSEKKLRAKVNLSEVMFSIFNDYQKKYESLVINATLDPITFRGDAQTWRTVLQNIIDNNIRHGAETITVHLSEHKLIMDNDGEQIPEDLLKRLFTPYEKGSKGSFGLGLTIIQKSLAQFDYSISIDNTENGVRYTIEDSRS